MIFGLSTPLWLARNWRLIAGIVLGALMCWPLAHCQGERDGRRTEQARLTLAAEKVRTAAAKAELAASAADALRRSYQVQRQKELTDVVEEKGTADPVGPGVAGVIAKLRTQAARRDAAARQSPDVRR